MWRVFDLHMYATDPSFCKAYMSCERQLEDVTKNLNDGLDLLLQALHKLSTYEELQFEPVKTLIQGILEGFTHHSG